MNILILSPAPDIGDNFGFDTLKAVADADLVIAIREDRSSYIFKADDYSDTVKVVKP